MVTTRSMAKAVKGAVEDLTSALGRMNVQSSNQTTLEKLQTKVKTLQTKVKTLETKIEKLKKELPGLEGEAKLKRAEEKVLEGKIKELEDTLDTSRSKNNDILATIEATEQSIRKAKSGAEKKRHEKNLQQAKDDLIQILLRINSSTEEKDKRGAKLKALSMKIDEIQKKIARTKDQIQSTKNQIQSTKDQIQSTEHDIHLNLWNQLDQKVTTFSGETLKPTTFTSTSNNSFGYAQPDALKKWEEFEYLFLDDDFVAPFKNVTLEQQLNMSDSQVMRREDIEEEVTGAFYVFWYNLMFATKKAYSPITFVRKGQVIVEGLRPDMTIFFGTDLPVPLVPSVDLPSFPIEFKRPQNFTPSDSNDLSKEMSRRNKNGIEKKDMHPIRQIYTYSCLLKSHYLVLSTFEYTWFGKREKGEVFFSRGFGSDETETSLARAWALFLKLVSQRNEKNEVSETFQKWSQDKESFKSPDSAQDAKTAEQSSGSSASESKGTGGAGGGAASHGRSRGDLGELPLDKISASFDPIETFDGLNHGIAYRNVINGYDSVIKVVETPKDEEGSELLNYEAGIYTKLRGLWGRHIPNMIYAGPISLARNVLAITYEGKSLDRLQDWSQLGMSKDELKRKAEEAVEEVHKLGVLHGDVALRNIVVDPKRKSLRLIDFGNATEVEPGLGSVAKKQEEMEKVSQLFDDGNDDA